MARYIDVDEMKKQLCEDCGILYETDVEKCDKNCLLMDTVDCMETLDVQPVVHGKWFLDRDSSSEEDKCYRCSNCKAVLEEDYKWHNHNYCYNCGARMDKE